MNLLVHSHKLLSVESQPVEIVERKGLGHPDSICDALAEQVSVALCHFYYEHFGCLLHHNVDKALLWGGMTRPNFGGGEVLAPMEIFLAGRVTSEFQGIKIPVEELAIKSCQDWFQQNFHALEPEQHVKFHCLFRPGSVDLAQLYSRATEKGIGLANDTSCGVGFSPLSPLEQVVYRVERYLNCPEVKNLCPEIGQDIKVMGIRHGESIQLTIACAFVDRFIKDIDDYCCKKNHLQKLVQEVASQTINMPVEHGQSISHIISVEVNTGDDVKRENIYLTVTGTSGEAGDDGQVGRGNRANGLITPYRPMTLEAVAGKNPVTHVGKLYNVVASQIAEVIVAQIPDIVAAHCYLVSQIGHLVREPQLVDVQIQTRESHSLESLRPHIEEIVRDRLGQIDHLWQRFLKQEISNY